LGINAKNSYGGYTGFRLVVGKSKIVAGKIASFEYIGGNVDELRDVVEMYCCGVGYRF